MFHIYSKVIQFYVYIWVYICVYIISIYFFRFFSIISYYKISNIVPHAIQWTEVKVTQSCPTLCDPMDYTDHGILQARILEWVAFPFSMGSSQPRDRSQVSCIVGGFFFFFFCRWILYQLSHKGSLCFTVVWLWSNLYVVASANHKFPTDPSPNWSYFNLNRFKSTCILKRETSSYAF